MDTEMTTKPFGKRPTRFATPCTRKVSFTKNDAPKPPPSYHDLEGTPAEDERTPIDPSPFGFSTLQYVVGFLALMAVWIMITGSAINHATKEGLNVGDRMCETIYYDAIQRRDCMAQQRYILTGKRH